MSLFKQQKTKIFMDEIKLCNLCVFYKKKFNLINAYIIFFHSSIKLPVDNV
jgi:hypothetical protein